MKKFNILFSIISCLFVASCNSKNSNIISSANSESNFNSNSEANNESSENIATNNKVLITYFSYSNNTANVANSINKAINSDNIRIVPSIPYTSSDVDYTNSSSRSQVERKENARPEINKQTYEAINLSNYNNVLIGYPIWNNYSPMIIKTFIEHELNGLKNKNIYTFSTSASSSGNNAFNDLKNTYSDLNFVDNLHLTASNLSNMDNIVNNKINDWNLKGSETMENKRLELAFNNTKVYATLANNTPANDLKERLINGPITFSFKDFAGSEKIAYSNPILKINNEEGCDPKIGDIVIYKPWNNIAIFYKDTATFSSDLIFLARLDENEISKIANINNDFNITFKLI